MANIRHRIHFQHFRLSHLGFKHNAQQFLLLLLGVSLAAIGFVVFKAPFNLAGGGVIGIGLIISNYTGLPVGILYLLLNIPILAFGYRHLGRWPFVFRAGIASVLFALLTDLFSFWAPRILDPFPPSDDILLSAIYGGILGGIGAGIVYRTGSSMGGTGIIGRWLQLRKGQPLSQIYVYTDGVVLIAMGLVFGWTVTLYGLLILFISGIASDYILEGPSTTRVATIVSDHPEALSEALTKHLGRGTSYWKIVGGYTGQNHYLLTCTISRPQVIDVKRLVAEVDPEAFLTISVGHQAIGEGFSPKLRSN